MRHIIHLNREFLVLNEVGRGVTRAGYPVPRPVTGAARTYKPAADAIILPLIEQGHGFGERDAADLEGWRLVVLLAGWSDVLRSLLGILFLMIILLRRCS